MNNICITGRLTAMPEIKKTGSGVSVCSLNVAVDRDYKSNGERVTDFIPCVFWRSTAEFVERYFSKGDMIAVEGTLESRSYKDKNGNNRTAWKVKANKVSFCGGKKDSAQANRPQGAQEQELNIESDEFDDDLPF